MIRRELAKDPTMVVFRDTWKSLTDMVRASAQIECDSFYGYTQKQLVSFMEHGDKETSKKARARFGEFIDVFMPEQMDLIPIRDTGVVGSSPCVPALLAGRPDSMYRDVWEEGPGLCRIYVQGNCYGGVSTDAMLERGIACAALAYAIQTTRPVELYWFACNARGGGAAHQLSLVRLPTAPLDLDRAGTLFSRVGIFRHSMDRQTGRSYGGYSRRRPDSLFDLTPEDIIIPPVHHNDVSSLSKGALEWVKYQVQHQEQARRATADR